MLQTIKEEKRELQVTVALNNETILKLQSEEQNLNGTVESQRRALEQSREQEAHALDLADKYREELETLRKSHDAISKVNMGHVESIKKLVSLRTTIPRTETEVEELFNELGNFGYVAPDELKILRTHLIDVVTERSNELLNLHKANEELQDALTGWLDATKLARESLEVERVKAKDLKVQCRALDEELQNTRIRFANEVDGTRKLYQDRCNRLETTVEKQQQLAGEEKKLREVGNDGNDDTMGYLAN